MVGNRLSVVDNRSPEAGNHSPRGPCPVHRRPLTGRFPRGGRRTAPGPAQSASCPYQARSSCFIDRWNAITSASTTSGCIWADSDFFACIRSGPLPDS